MIMSSASCTQQGSRVLNVDVHDIVYYEAVIMTWVEVVATGVEHNNSIYVYDRYYLLLHVPENYMVNLGLY